ncbi:MAG: hypothetical protein ACTSWN_08670 [Promethearchaeota archaeon]
MNSKPSSNMIISKLRDLFKRENYTVVVQEINYYLDSFGNNYESPLVMELIYLLKEVIYRDLEHIASNLEIIEKLFEIPDTRVQEQVLDVFMNLSSMTNMKIPLFNRFHVYLKNNFLKVDDRLKERFVDVIINFSRDSEPIQEKMVKFFLEQFRNSEGHIVPLLLRALAKLLDENPDLDLFFIEYMDDLFERFLFVKEDNIETQQYFLNLFTYLHRYHYDFIKRAIKCIKQPDTYLKEKALLIFPIMMKNSFDLQVLDLLFKELDSPDVNFQVRVVETLHDIICMNLNYHLSRVIKYYYDVSLSPNELQRFVDLFAMLANEDFELVFLKIFNNMKLGFDLSFQKSLAVMEYLDFEYPKQLEFCLFKVFEDFPQYYWRTKQEILEKVWSIIKHLNRELLTIWFSRILEKITSNSETEDQEIVQFASELFKEIIEMVPDAKIKLKDLNDRISYIEKNLTLIKNYPRLFRERLTTFINDLEPSKILQLLHKEFNATLERVLDFDEIMENIEFKHLILNLMEEWIYLKDYILEDLNIVRDYLEEEIKKKEVELARHRQEEISKIEKKKEIIEMEFKGIINDKDGVIINDVNQLMNFLNKLTRFNTKMTAFDIEVNSLVIDNSFLYPEYEKCILSWSVFKKRAELEISKITNVFDKWLKENQYKIDDDEKEQFNTQMVENFYNKFVRNSIEEFKNILNQLEENDRKINELIQREEFEKAMNFMNFKRNKFIDLIERKSNEIEKYMKMISKLSRNISHIMNLKRIHDSWLVTKDNLLERINNFHQTKLGIIDAEKIRLLLEIVNPIPINALKNLLKSIDFKTDFEYMEGIINLIQKHNIYAQIHEKKLYNIKRFILKSQLEIPLKIHTTILTKNNHVFLKANLKNHSIYDMYDIFISIKTPKFLKVESDIMRNYNNKIHSISAGKYKIFHWSLKLLEDEIPAGKSNTLLTSKIIITIRGKVSGERNFSLIKEIDFIYRE